MHPGGGQLPIPGHSTGLDLYQARKRGALGLPPPPLFSGRGFPGFWGPPPVLFWLGFAPRDLAPGSSGS